ncbi:MAG TPA: IMP dehydrogenase [Patescibacteria group bacterium]|nr:IMP dehydrogenase [Patescibacteria group bacterium]
MRTKKNIDVKGKIKVRKKHTGRILQVLPPFSTFRDVNLWETYICGKLAPFEKKVSEYLKFWYIESRENSHSYPSQGMLTTPFDFLPYTRKAMIEPEEMVRILRVRQYFLELFNHPERIKELKRVQHAPYIPAPKVQSSVMETVIQQGLALSVSDLGISVVGSDRERVSREERFRHGPFVKLGRRARSFLVGSAMPDIYGSVSAIATMAQCLCLVGVPRNGPFHVIQRQVDLVKEVWKALGESEVLLGRSTDDKAFLLNQWKHNVMGVLETTPLEATHRAQALYDAGMRVFRVYSPEPGKGALHTVQALRKIFGNKVEIFVGQIVDVEQARQLEAAGADGLYVGIGGGGRCITGVRSGSVIDWPQLLWNLRGAVTIPTIVEGGASDHIAVTLALGATGIGVSRIVGGGTIESPGGMLYCVDKDGKLFKPYGGEASARTKFLDNKMLPFQLPSFVEGETRTANLTYLPYGVPTIPFNVFNLTEDTILSFVFRAVRNLEELHALNPSPIRQKTEVGEALQKTH